jgi:glycosyltransferase involved in cell wall biosynthesis
MSESRKRVLFQLNHLSEYRIPIFERLGRRHDVDIVVSSPPPAHPTSFTVIQSRHSRFWKFALQGWSGRKVAEYDAVFSIFDMRNLTAFALILRHPNRVAPYCLGYGRGLVSSLFRRLVFSHSRVSLVYSQGTAQQLIKSGVPGRKVHYTGNTIAVLEAPIPDGPRSTFLHVGTPKPRKRVQELIAAFSRVMDRLPPHVTITIVGKGSRTAYGAYAAGSPAAGRIIFHDDVRDETVLADLFGQAIAYVGPGHVGLGALQAIGHGVPVVTRSDVEHGPEFETCIDNHTARLYRHEAELAEILVELATDPAHARSLGLNGRALYDAAYHPDQMVDRMCAAIEALSEES